MKILSRIIQRLFATAIFKQIELKDCNSFEDRFGRSLEFMLIYTDGKDEYFLSGSKEHLQQMFRFEFRDRGDLLRKLQQVKIYVPRSQEAGILTTVSFGPSK